MIFYFSATGNNKHIADVISNKTRENTLSIHNCLCNGKYGFTLDADEMLGIISPTYFWGLPKPVCDFLDRLNIITDYKPYTFFVASYGTTNGMTGYQVNTYLSEKGYPLDAKFSVKMPDTWTPIFNLSDKIRVEKMVDRADGELQTVAERIVKRQSGDYMKMKMPTKISNSYYKWAYAKYGITSSFSVTEDCIGCGLCARSCPAAAITIQDGKPVWTKKECALCLGCLHNCPKFAIDYGNSTRKHGQYNYSHYRK